MGQAASSLSELVTGKEIVTMPMVGLGFAGKTSIIHYLEHGEVLPNSTITVLDGHSIDYKRFRLQIWDVGGQSMDEIKDKTVLVFANKQDIPGAMTASEVTDILGLDSLGARCWRVQSASAMSGEGIHDGFDWLCDNVTGIKLSLWHRYLLVRYRHGNVFRSFFCLQS